MTPEEINKILDEYQKTRQDNFSDAQLSQLSERQTKAGIAAKKSGHLAKICVDGGLATVKSGQLAYARSCVKNLPSNTTVIIAVNVKTQEEIEYTSQHHASRELNLPVGNINKILKGLRKKAGNFSFKYKE